jgi:broad specificity phosphatase PhoE
MKTLQIVRHGQSLNQIRQAPWLDPDLSSEGVHQAESIQDYFADREYDLIISSPLTRARRTFLLSRARAPRAEFDSRLVESTLGRGADYDYREILPYETPDFAEPDQANMWTVPSGARIRSLLADLRERPEERILMFGHCAIFYVLLQHIQGNIYDDEPIMDDQARSILMDNTALSEMRLGSAPGEDRVVEWNLNIQDVLV